jgi:hypothetical protein
VLRGNWLKADPLNFASHPYLGARTVSMGKIFGVEVQSTSNLHAWVKLRSMQCASVITSRHLGGLHWSHLRLMSSRSNRLGSWVMTIIRPYTAAFLPAEKIPSCMGHIGADGTTLPRHSGAYMRLGEQTDRTETASASIGPEGLLSFNGGRTWQG